jgi:hypothetical protein
MARNMWYFESSVIEDMTWKRKFHFQILLRCIWEVILKFNCN